MQLSITRRQVTRTLRQIILYSILISSSVVLAMPLFWMVSTSLKSVEEANAPKITLWAEKPQLTAYQDVKDDPDWARYLSNSVFVTGLAILGTISSIAAVAFAFSRIQWPGRDKVFFLMLSTLMLPPQTTLVPQYVFFNKIDWVGTFNPITIPGFFAGGAALIFLLRQFMLSLPKEIDEAALIDGASYFQIWWRITLPLSKAALATITVFMFVGSWNSLQYPLIYLQRANLHTLPIAISSLINPQQSHQPWPLIMAVSVLTVLPLIAVFFMTQRYFVESIVLTGQKG